MAESHRSQAEGQKLQFELQQSQLELGQASLRAQAQQAEEMAAHAALNLAFRKEHTQAALKTQKHDMLLKRQHNEAMLAAKKEQTEAVREHNKAQVELARTTVELQAATQDRKAKLATAAFLQTYCNNNPEDAEAREKLRKLTLDL